MWISQINIEMDHNCADFMVGHQKALLFIPPYGRPCLHMTIRTLAVFT